MAAFPVLELEPPRRPIWRKALIAGAALAAVALVVVLALILPGSGSPPKRISRPPTWTAQVPGEVIGWSQSASTLVAMTPSGQLRTPAVLASHITNPPLTSPSGFELLTNTGQAFYVENRQLTARPKYSSESDLSGPPFNVLPFADSGNAVVQGGLDPEGRSQPAIVVNLQSGNTHKLPGAPVDQAEGDPTSLGAWVTVVGGPPAGSTEDPQQPDSRVEYRTPGEPPVTLATANRLRRLAGFKGSHGLELTPYPSPSGRQIAIDVEQTGPPSGAPEAIVVLSRSGHLVAKMSAVGLTQLTWAESSRELLVLRSSSALSMWVLGHASARTVHLPNTASGWGSCILAPASTYAICSSYQGQQVDQWALIRLSDLKVAIEPAHEVPADWTS